MPTTAVPLSESYALLGTGAMLLRCRTPGVARLHFGTSAPADDTEEYLSIDNGETVSYNLTENVYARVGKGVGIMEKVA